LHKTSSTAFCGESQKSGRLHCTGMHKCNAFFFFILLIILPFKPFVENEVSKAANGFVIQILKPN